MAIDGIKIIDSDLAHDIKNFVMEHFHYAEPLENIRKGIEAWSEDASEFPLHWEIYHTAYALVMWEIGAILPEQIAKVREIVSQKASPEWNKLAENAQDKRQKELEKLLEKIQSPNPSPKKCKNWKRITDFCFEKGDLLTFQRENGHYGAVILISAENIEGKAEYEFAEIIYSDEFKPTAYALENAYVVGRNSGLWLDAPRIISHKNLLKIKDSFEKVGNPPQPLRRRGFMVGRKMSCTI